MLNRETRTVIRGGSYTQEVLDMLGYEIKAPEAIESITDRAARIIELSVDPIAGPPPQPSDGLLYGLIQSGKTSIITVASAMAGDNGFNCVVILTSDIDPLYDQTLQRVKRVLRRMMVLGKNDWKDASRFERHLRTPPVVIVCSKNGSRLNNLLNAFKTAGARGLSVLIIDDEADQASLNTHTRKGGDKISKINEVITSFRNYFPVNTYLQVTATPQALFLQRPDHSYRPSFTVLSEPGPGYVGGEAFFGPESDLLKYVDLDEVNDLRATHQPSPTGTIPKGLKRALFTFFVGAAARIIRDLRETSSFLCHVSISKDDHAHIVGLMERFKEGIVGVLEGGSSSGYDKVVQGLQIAYDDLSGTEADLPEFELILENVKSYIRGTNIKLVNASSGEEISLDSVFNIFVGGNKLGRGVTIKNLLVSYYGRNPKKPNSDTVLQHARMYGYRKDTLGLTRLFLPKKLAEHFRLIHQMEKALRVLVAKHPDGKFEGIYISSPLRATRQNVLDPNSIGMYVGGGYCNPRYPLRNEETVGNTEWIDQRLMVYNDRAEYDEITIDEVSELIGRCAFDPAFGAELWDQKTLSAALGKLKTLSGNKAYILVRRKRALQTPREETQGFLSGGDVDLVPQDSLTLFIYRIEEEGGNKAAWWPLIRFPEGNYVIAFSFNR